MKRGHNKKEKPQFYKWGECDKKYNLSSNLARHKQFAHSGEKINCKICSKEFSNKHYLKCHLESVHSKPVSYDICEKTYSNRKSLMNHV